MAEGEGDGAVDVGLIGERFVPGAVGGGAAGPGGFRGRFEDVDADVVGPAEGDEILPIAAEVGQGVEVNVAVGGGVRRGLRTED